MGLLFDFDEKRKTNKPHRIYEPLPPSLNCSQEVITVSADSAVAFQPKVKALNVFGGFPHLAETYRHQVGR